MTPDEIDQALCAQTDPTMFFPEHEGSGTPAKKICASCPVREACLQEALADANSVGVWGGTTTHERKVMRRELGIRPQPLTFSVRSKVHTLTSFGWTPEQIASELHVGVRQVRRYLEEDAA